jgi:hypothetical protein
MESRLDVPLGQNLPFPDPMTWSEWIQEPDYEGVSEWVNADLSEVQMQSHASNYTESNSYIPTSPIVESCLAGAQGGGGPVAAGDPITAFSTTNGFDAEIQAFTEENNSTSIPPPPYFKYHAYTSIYFTQSAATYGLNSYSLDSKDTFPEPLYDLIEDVDYAVIPGMDPDVDDYAYVEYESYDNNVLTGWADWTLTLTGRGTGTGEITDADTPTTLRVGFSEPVTWDSTGPGWWTSYQGSLLESIAGFTGTSSTPYDGAPFSVPHTLSLADLGVMESWTLYQQPHWLVSDVPINLNVVSGPPLTPGSAAMFTSTVLIPASRPRFTYRMPRWRYWVPGDPILYPLRQVQRDDGLARAVMRARSTHSIQRSIRQRSYR